MWNDIISQLRDDAEADHDYTELTTLCDDYAAQIREATE